MKSLEFARAQKLNNAPCYSLLFAWAKANGVKNIPSDNQARKWWFSVGPAQGMYNAAEYMGLKKSDGNPGDLAVVEQDNGEPILALLSDGGFCVVRSFGQLSVWKPKIIYAWSLPVG